jgi:hypothetical protein
MSHPLVEILSKFPLTDETCENRKNRSVTFAARFQGDPVSAVER